jgi:hypothetical protein
MVVSPCGCRDRCGVLAANASAFSPQFRDCTVLIATANKPPKPEHDPEKWDPVFGKDHAQTKKLDHDPIQLNRIMV